MFWTARKDMEKEKCLHRMWQENVQRSITISKLQAVLECEANRIGKIEQKHIAEIETHIRIVEEIEESNVDEIRRIM